MRAAGRKDTADFNTEATEGAEDAEEDRVSLSRGRGSG
jgi:hypothetical protein